MTDLQPITRTFVLGTLSCEEMPLADFAKWLDGLMKALPEEHRHFIKIQIGDDSNWEDSRTEFSVFYSRLETAEEAKYRVDEQARIKARSVESEIERAKQILRAHGLL